MRDEGQKQFTQTLSDIEKNIEFLSNDRIPKLESQIKKYESMAKSAKKNMESVVNDQLKNAAKTEGVVVMSRMIECQKSLGERKERLIMLKERASMVRSQLRVFYSELESVEDKIQDITIERLTNNMNVICLHSLVISSRVIVMQSLKRISSLRLLIRQQRMTFNFQ